MNIDMNQKGTFEDTVSLSSCDKETASSGLDSKATQIIA